VVRTLEAKRRTGEGNAGGEDVGMGGEISFLIGISSTLVLR